MGRWRHAGQREQVGARNPPAPSGQGTGIDPSSLRQPGRRMGCPAATSATAVLSNSSRTEHPCDPHASRARRVAARLRRQEHRPQRSSSGAPAAGPNQSGRSSVPGHTANAPTRTRPPRRTGQTAQSRSLPTGRPSLSTTERRRSSRSAYLRRRPELVDATRRELAGRDLTCGCKPREEYNTDELLRIAAGGEP